MTHERPRVVIIGGGFAGVAAARALARAPAEVVLIDRHNHHVFQPLLYQVATAALMPGDIAAPIRAIFTRQPNCQVLMGEVTDIDITRSVVRFDGRELAFDHLILATGMVTNYFGQDAWAAHAPGMKTLDEAIDVRSRFLTAFEEAELEPDPDTRRRILTFAIVGAGPTGVELAGAMSEIAREMSRDFRTVDTRSTRILLLDFADRVLTPFDERLSARAQADLERLGVEVVLGARVTDVGPDGLTAETPDGELKLRTHHIVWAAGVRGTPLAECLGVPLDRAGRVPVRPDLSVEGHPHVFVAGDMAHHVDPKSGKQVPGVAQGAIQGGDFVGRTLAAELKARAAGRTPPPRGTFHYKDKGSLAIIGRNRAVAELMGLKLSGMLAFLIWAMVHILFLIDFRRRVVVFMEWVWMYLSGRHANRLITRDDEVPGGSVDG